DSAVSWCPPEARPFRSGIDYSAPPTERTSVPGCIRQRQAVVRLLSRSGVSNGRARRALRAGLLAGYVVIKLGGASSSFGHINPDRRATRAQPHEHWANATNCDGVGQGAEPHARFEVRRSRDNRSVMPVVMPATTCD